MNPDVSLKEYFDMRINNVKEAVETASTSMNIRLEGMNEFRNSLKDQTAKFPIREEVTIQFEQIKKDIRDLLESRALLQGKASQQSLNYTQAISIAGLILGAVSILVNFI